MSPMVASRAVSSGRVGSRLVLMNSKPKNTRRSVAKAGGAPARRSASSTRARQSMRHSVAKREGPGTFVPGPFDDRLATLQPSIGQAEDGELAAELGVAAERTVGAHRTQARSALGQARREADAGPAP